MTQTIPLNFTSTADASDESVLAFTRQIIATYGRSWTQQYNELFQDNTTMEPYWPTGVKALAQGNIDAFVFSAPCMLGVTRKHLAQRGNDSSFTRNDAVELLDDLMLILGIADELHACGQPGEGAFEELHRRQQAVLAARKK